MTVQQSLVSLERPVNRYIEHPLVKAMDWSECHARTRSVRPASEWSECDRVKYGEQVIEGNVTPGLAASQSKERRLSAGETRLSRVGSGAEFECTDSCIRHV